MAKTQTKTAALSTKTPRSTYGAKKVLTEKKKKKTKEPEMDHGMMDALIGFIAQRAQQRLNKRRHAYATSDPSDDEDGEEEEEAEEEKGSSSYATMEPLEEEEEEDSSDAEEEEEEEDTAATLPAPTHRKYRLAVCPVFPVKPMKKRGSRAEVLHGKALKTAGGLTKEHLAVSKNGLIVSKQRQTTGFERHVEHSAFLASGRKALVLWQLVFGGKAPEKATDTEGKVSKGRRHYQLFYQLALAGHLPPDVPKKGNKATTEYVKKWQTDLAGMEAEAERLVGALCDKQTEEQSAVQLKKKAKIIVDVLSSPPSSIAASTELLGPSTAAPVVPPPVLPVPMDTAVAT